MPSKFITPPLGIYGLPNTGTAEQLLLQCWNNDDTALTLRHGDVVVIDRSALNFPAPGAGATGAAGGAVKTIPNSKDPSVLGPVSNGDSQTNTSITYPLNDILFVAVAGIARVNCNGVTLNFANWLQTSTTRARPQQLITAALTDIGTIFATALESAPGAQDAGPTVRCLVARG